MSNLLPQFQINSFLVSKYSILKGLYLSFYLQLGCFIGCFNEQNFEVGIWKTFVHGFLVNNK
jgi:hypothetical protein